MAPEPSPGLCPSCTHARRVESARGSAFLMCLRSQSDARYAKYPRLPVVSCPGFEAAHDPETEQPRA
jgi:hypothetical protein